VDFRAPPFFAVLFRVAMCVPFVTVCDPDGHRAPCFDQLRPSSDLLTGRYCTGSEPDGNSAHGTYVGPLPFGSDPTVHRGFRKNKNFFDGFGFTIPALQSVLVRITTHRTCIMFGDGNSGMPDPGIRGRATFNAPCASNRAGRNPLHVQGRNR
jgi:hypothetical protein